MAHAGLGIPKSVVSALEMGGVAGVYYLSAHPGVAEAVGAAGHVRVIWPASGIGVAALLIFGLKVLPGLVLGAGLHSLSIGRSPSVVIGITVAVTVGALLAVLCLRRAGFRTQMNRARDALAFVAFASVLAMMVSAVLYAATLAAAGVVHLEDTFSLSLTTWLSWGLGVLVVTPVILVLGNIRRLPQVQRSRVLEVLGLVAATAAVTYLALAVSDPMLFLVFPILIWVAWRFQLPGTAPCVLVVSAIVVSTTMAGAGPFSASQSPSTAVTLQAFIGSLALASLFLAVGITERDQARDEILRTAHQLAEVVRHVEEHLRPHEAAPRAEQPPLAGADQGTDTATSGEPDASGEPAHTAEQRSAEPLRIGGIADLTGQLTTAESDCDLIERAIGILMQQRRCDLDTARTVIRRDAQAANQSVRAYAANLIARTSRRP